MLISNIDLDRQVSFAGHKSKVACHRSQVTGHRSRLAQEKYAKMHYTLIPFSQIKCAKWD